MMVGEVILYEYWRSSASYRVRIALNLAGIAYRSVPVDLLKKEQKSPEYLKRNPQGLVPALEIDGVLLTQSLAIIEYLAETRGLPGILPAAPMIAPRCAPLPMQLPWTFTPSAIQASLPMSWKSQAKARRPAPAG